MIGPIDGFEGVDITGFSLLDGHVVDRRDQHVRQVDKIDACGGMGVAGQDQSRGLRFHVSDSRFQVLGTRF